MPESQQQRLAALKAENLRLQRAVKELSVLNELTGAISASLDPQKIMQTIIQRSIQAVRARQGDITLLNHQSPAMTQTLVRTMDSSVTDDPFHFNQSLLGWMLKNRQPLNVAHPQQDPRFRHVIWDANIQSMLCTPLLVKSDLIGILTVYNKIDDEAFTRDDQRLLSIIAGQSAQVIETARLYEEEKKLLRIHEELRLANEIQTRLLPKASPVLNGYDIAAKSVPAHNVGGDYFDFIAKSANQLVFCLGDITGKGIPAALLMANLQATIRGITLSNTSCCECIDKANSILFHNTESDKFATLFFGMIDAETQRLHFCNAGHNAPILLRNTGQSERLKTGGLMIGVFEESEYEEEAVSMHPGDMLVVFSDGISEVLNTAEEEYSEQRLLEFVRTHPAQTAAELIESILADARSFAGPIPPSDDMTLLVIRRLMN
ncbi:MAG: SpoIIE family protein phosphatase [candidate division KSB1 bacterium]|nr:SpoIIE family protein phosphatase [candidate division KSB1 bacterium]MDQ7065280.1 SpoIIE family protein phosphatase [candidate division KSB1 bacterium]